MDAVRGQPVAFRFAAAGVTLMLVGTIGAWTDVPVVGPVADRGDKLMVIGVAVLAALFLWHHTREGGPTLGVAGMTLGLIGSVMCGLLLYDLLSEPFANPGWGVYVSLLGSLVLAGSSFALWREETY
jgi:hypothetical protein